MWGRRRLPGHGGVAGLARNAGLARIAGLLCLTGSLSLGAPAGVIAQTGESLPLTWENIFTRSTGARQAALSPDGRTVAVAASTPEGSGIFLVGVDAAGAVGSTAAGASDPAAPGVPARADPSPRLLVEGGSSPVWMPHGDAILFSARGDLWIAPVGDAGAPSGGAPVDLGAPPPDVVRVTDDEDGERAARPSPDGSSVAFYSGRAGHQDIWLVDADGSGEPRQLTRESMASDDFRFAPAWSPDGERIAYFSNKAEYWHDDIWIVDVATGEERQVSTGLMASSTPVWSPDGSRIALLGTSKDEYWYEDLAYIYVLDAEAGAERIVDMQVHATDWLHNLGVYWSADGSELYFPYLQRAQMELWRVPAEGGVATRMTNMGGHFRSYHTNGAASGFVFIRSTPTRGTETDYLDVRGGPVRRLTHFATEWEGLAEPEEISYRSWDGLYIQGFLYRPPDFDPAASYPALVQVHGGGTNAYLHALNTTEQYLARQGYLVLAVNYRGGSGFGRAFQDLGVEDWANGQAWFDRWLRDEP